MDADLIRNGQTELAWAAPARQEAVDAVMQSQIGVGRSEWVWLRLANGDLFLAVAPMDAVYDEVQAEPGTEWGDGPSRWVQHDSNLKQRLLDDGWRIVGDDGARYRLEPPASTGSGASG